MTEQATTTVPATTLSLSLVADSPTLMEYRGALTPDHFDALEAEIGAMIHATAVYDLGWLRRIAVRGEDRFRWLSGMVTNSVETLPDQAGAYNLVLNAQGRIQGDAFVWRNGEAVELEVTAEQTEALLAHLDHFIIMDDVELVALPEVSALGLTGPAAATLLNSLGLKVPVDELAALNGFLNGVAVRVERGYSPASAHFAIWADTVQIPQLWASLISAGGKPVGAAAIETIRVVEGIPAYGIDIQSRDLAQETGQMRALSFTKGCYLGQEIVERIRSRGQVHRHLRQLELTLEAGVPLPFPGTELFADEKPAGTLTSVAQLDLAAVQPERIRRIFAIGMVRAEAEAIHKSLTFPGGTARILNSPPILTTA